MRTRTAVVLVGGVVLLLAVPFAGVTWAFGGKTALLAFVVPLALPALTRADKLGKRAAQVGFEWRDASGALEKLDEELGELRAEVTSGASRAQIAQELGYAPNRMAQALPSGRTRRKVPGPACRRVRDTAPVGRARWI